MCVEIICDGTLIEGVDDMIRRFGADKVFVQEGYAVSAYLGHGCLCPVDIEATAEENGYVIEELNGDSMMLVFRRTTKQGGA